MVLKLNFFGRCKLRKKLVPFFKLAIVQSLFVICHLNYAFAEPLVVLEYRNGNVEGVIDSENPFALDPDYSAQHKVNPGEVLGGIIKKYYGGSGLDLRFVQLAIIAVNPKAFARNNPNYLFAGPTLKLPSIRQIQNLVIGIPLDNEVNLSPGRDLYFFGS